MHAAAMQVLFRLLQLGHADEFLPALVAMEMSLHSMEVVNRLSTAIDLPLQFVHEYISNCIRSCQSAQVRARYNLLLFKPSANAWRQVRTSMWILLLCYCQGVVSG